jgi:hypothetical protein
VPRSYSLDPQLGRWVGTQRAVFKKGRMDFERKAKLDEIGFEFSGQDKANKGNWNLQFKKLQGFYGKHGHCELFWAVDIFTFILNTLTNNLSSSLPELQVTCHEATALTRHWANGSTLSIHASKMAEWILNEERSSTRLVSS